MIINHSPKAEFLRDEAATRAHRDLVVKDSYKKALIHATAQFALSCPSSDQMSAVNGFIYILNNLAESEDQSGGQFPHKPLQQPEKLLQDPPQQKTPESKK